MVAPPFWPSPRSERCSWPWPSPGTAMGTRIPSLGRVAGCWASRCSEVVVPICTRAGLTKMLWNVNNSYISGWSYSYLTNFDHVSYGGIIIINTVNMLRCSYNPEILDAHRTLGCTPACTILLHPASRECSCPKGMTLNAAWRFLSLSGR